MRMAFGLIGFLVVTGVIVWIMLQVELPHVQQAASAQKVLKPQAERISGYDSDGRAAGDAVQLTVQESNGRIKGFLVTKIIPEGNVAQIFGLQPNDVITEIGPESAQQIGSAAEAKNSLTQAVETPAQYPVVVMRNNQKLTLPLPAAAGEAKKPALDDALKQLNQIPAPR